MFQSASFEPVAFIAVISGKQFAFAACQQRGCLMFQSASFEPATFNAVIWRTLTLHSDVQVFCSLL
jgi:hypothetical protein